nr:anti-sigma factor [Lysinibacillus timonensis]
MDSNIEVDKRNIKKSRNTLPFKVLLVFLIIAFLYAVYINVVNIIADEFNEANEHAFFSSLALEWTVPNVRSDFEIQDEQQTFFGTKNFSYNLTKIVGQEDFVIGKAEVTKSLSDSNSSIHYSHPGLDRLGQFSFSLPEDPRTGEKLEANTSRNVWESLEILPEGTVAELAFSTTDFMTSKQLVESLHDYDLHILWMPLYTGEFKDYDPGAYTGSSKMIIVSQVLGLTGGKDHDEDYHETMRIRWLDEESVNESEQLMLKNMEKMLTKSESYFEQFLGLGHLEEKYQYLVDEGFIVYGAVVTGPVKELLKLQDLSFVQGEQLGEVELWNW